MDPTDASDGRYAATVEFPCDNDWNVRFTVVPPRSTMRSPILSRPQPTAASNHETTA